MRNDVVGVLYQAESKFMHRQNDDLKTRISQDARDTAWRTHVHEEQAEVPHTIELTIGSDHGPSDRDERLHEDPKRAFLGLVCHPSEEEARNDLKWNFSDTGRLMSVNLRVVEEILTDATCGGVLRRSESRRPNPIALSKTGRKKAIA